MRKLGGLEDTTPLNLAPIYILHLFIEPWHVQTRKRNKKIGKKENLSGLLYIYIYIYYAFVGMDGLPNFIYLFIYYIFQLGAIPA
jgi:hypothetical protein